jgi:hypothetical protein
MDIISNIFNLNIPVIINDLVNFFQSPQVQSTLFILKIVSGVICLFLFLFIVFLVLRSSYLKYAFFEDFFEFFAFKPYGQTKLEKRWEGISKRLEKGLESEYKLAVIETEGILDEVLIRMGLSGQSFGERLEKINKTQLSNLDDVLEAHKIRNNVVHDPDYKLTLDQTRKSLEIYEKALKELGALE